MRKKYMQIHMQYKHIHTNTHQYWILRGMKPISGEIHADIYKYIWIHAKYMQNTCWSKQFTLTGFIPICIQIQSVLACICLYTFLLNRYWSVFYRHNTDQYWHNGGKHVWLDQPVSVPIIMYWSGLKCIDMYWPSCRVFICILHHKSASML